MVTDFRLSELGMLDSDYLNLEHPTVQGQSHGNSLDQMSLPPLFETKCTGRSIERS